jgi:hypothetical protein
MKNLTKLMISVLLLTSGAFSQDPILHSIGQLSQAEIAKIVVFEAKQQYKAISRVDKAAASNFLAENKKSINFLKSLDDCPGCKAYFEYGTTPHPFITITTYTHPNLPLPSPDGYCSPEVDEETGAIDCIESWGCSSLIFLKITVTINPGFDFIELRDATGMNCHNGHTRIQAGTFQIYLPCEVDADCGQTVNLFSIWFGSYPGGIHSGGNFVKLNCTDCFTP